MATVLVIGVTSGIGRKIAWQLMAEYTNLILVARSVGRFEEVAECTRQVTDIEVGVLPADLSQAEGTLRVCECLIGGERPVGLLVNNTGFGLGQDFVGGDIERELNTLSAMVRAVLVTYHAAILGMVARGGGGVLNIASMAALTTQGAHSTHKAWVRTFAEGLVASLKGAGVNATTVCPGLVHTKFHEKINVDPGQWPESVFIPAERVVAKVIEGVRHGRTVVTLSRRYRVLVGALKAAPRGLMHVIAGPERSGRRD